MTGDCWIGLSLARDSGLILADAYSRTIYYQSYFCLLPLAFRKAVLQKWMMYLKL